MALTRAKRPVLTLRGLTVYSRWQARFQGAGIAFTYSIHEKVVSALVKDAKLLFSVVLPLTNWTLLSCFFNLNGVLLIPTAPIETLIPVKLADELVKLTELPVKLADTPVMLKEWPVKLSLCPFRPVDVF